MEKQLQQQLAKAIKILHEVESRPWHDILLTCIDPTDISGEAAKLTRIAACYAHFVNEFPSADTDAKLAVYRLLRIMYDGQKFPSGSSKLLSKVQFERLLEIQLQYF